MADWFTENAPKPVAAADDWFAANAPAPVVPPALAPRQAAPPPAAIPTDFLGAAIAAHPKPEVGIAPPSQPANVVMPPGSIGAATVGHPIQAPTFEGIKGLVVGSPTVGDTPVGRAAGFDFEGPATPHVDTTSLPLLRPTALAPENPDSIGGGIERGIAKIAEGFTTPTNALMLAGSGGIGLLGEVSSLLPRAISAGFSLQMLNDLRNQYPTVKAAVESGDPAKIAEAVTEAVGTATMAGMAGFHAATGGHTSIAETPVDASTPHVAPREPDGNWFQDNHPSKATAAPTLTPEHIAARNQLSQRFADVDYEHLDPEEKTAVDALVARDILKTPESVTAPGIDIPKGEKLTPEEQVIEARFAETIKKDPEAALAAYRKENTRPDGTLVINTDSARELSPDYVADRTQSAAVHEPSSFIANRMFEAALKEPAPEGTANTVLFTAGGTGAGKTVGSAVLGDSKPPQILYDNNMSSYDSSVNKIEKALAAGKQVEIQYVHRDAMDAFANGMLPRATRMGRTVPIDSHVDTHTGAPETLLKIADKYADDPRVHIRVIDNTKGLGKAEIGSLDLLRDLDHTGLSERLNKEADAQFAAGKISPEVYRGVTGRSEIPGNSAESEQPQAAQPADAKEVGRGKTTTVYTPDETEAKVQYRVMDAGDLRTSFQDGYPQELQPRNTDRKGSRERIESIKSKLNPAKLGANVNAGDGAPIILEDGSVLTGNHRVEALRELSAEKSAKYQSWLKENAAEFGIDPKDIENIKNPVLVRQMVEAPPDLVRFAEESNGSTTARMSDSEKAEQMARRITPSMLAAFDPREDGTPNHEFVRGLMGDMTKEERAEYQDKDGKVSQSGIRAVKNAIFAKAYPDTSAIERMAESTDDNVRNISNGLLAAAPRVIEVKAGIENGDLHDLGIGDELARATHVVSELRQSKTSVEDWLKQDNLLGRDPVVDSLVDSISEFSRSAKRIGEFVKQYTKAVEAAGSPKQEGLFGAAEIPNRLEILEAARNEVRDQIRIERETREAAKSNTEDTSPRSSETPEDHAEPKTSTGDKNNPVEEKSPDSGVIAPVETKAKGATPDRRRIIQRGAHTPVDVEFKDKSDASVFDAVGKASLRRSGGNNPRGVDVGPLAQQREIWAKKLGLEPKDASQVLRDYHSYVKDLAKEQPKEDGGKIIPKSVEDFHKNRESSVVRKLEVAEGVVRARIAKRTKEAVNSLSTGPTLAAEQLADYAHLGALKIAKGAAKFAEWSKQMVAELGDAIKPHLADIWLESRDVHKATLKDLAEEAKPEVKSETKPAVKVEPAKEGIPGEPRVKESKLAKGVEAKAVENKLTEGFEGRPEYQTVNVKEQSKLATDLLRADPEKAIRIAMGEEVPPNGLLPESVFVAVENHATEKKDIGLLRDLATSSSLSMEATGMGQRIRMLAERNPDSPVAAIQKVAAARETAAEKKFGKNPKEKVKAQIKVELKKVKPRRDEWSKLIAEITCR